MKAKIFISHASEDKDAVARPLASALREHGFDVWYDEYSLEIGDNLRRQIDNGLQECNFGIVVLSHYFFSKEWPQRELDGLVNKELSGEKVVLPLWHEVSRDDVSKYSPILADRLAAKTTEGVEVLVRRIERAIEKLSRFNPPANSRAISPINSKFKFVRLSISGNGIHTLIPLYFESISGLENTAIKSFSLKIFEDASGLDLDASYVELESGAKWHLDEDVVLLFSAQLIPELPSEYEAVSWRIPERSRYDSDTLDLKDYECEVLFGRKPASIDPEDAFLFLSAVCAATEREFEHDLWWGATSFGRQLIRVIFSYGKLVEVCNYVRIQNERTRFLIAKAIVEEWSPGSGEGLNRLYEFLLDAQSPLNDHWKRELLGRQPVAPVQRHSE